MKLRIKSHSIRFRINAEDMEALIAHGEVIQETRIPQADGIVVTFRHGVRHDPAVEKSHLLATDGNMILVLDGSDFAELNDFVKEGVYVRREYMSDKGQPIRFVAYVEKDKIKKKHKDKGRDDADYSRHNAAHTTDEIEKDPGL